MFESFREFSGRKKNPFFCNNIKSVYFIFKLIKKNEHNNNFYQLLLYFLPKKMNKKILQHKRDI